MKKTKALFSGTEWDIPLIDKMWKAIDKIAKTKFKLDYYTPQIEIITSEQMLDCYSSVAMPVMYNHWSFGKTFIQNERQYHKGMQGLAYEVVINTNPCIAYLMENNTATLQALVLAHASVGHSSFFKCNYLFKKWTEADTIVDYLKFAKNYIKSCEEKHGEKRVEQLLDSCHSLQAHSIDKYKKPASLSKELKRQKEKDWEKYFESSFNDLWRTVPKQQTEEAIKEKQKDLPEENILYFLEKNSPILEEWEREILRIVRKVSQYFYPQRQTQLMNEGWATFCHHMIMTELHSEGLITDGSYLEFLQNHTNVVAQRDWDSKYYSGLNVYALGFAMFSDIKRMCISPDEEDKKWFPEICNTDWLTTVKYIMENYRDESFVLQFLSPKVARQFKLFSLKVDENRDYLQVSSTHDDESLLDIRRMLSTQYDLSRAVPQIEIVNVDWKDDRTLYLDHRTKNRQKLYYQTAKKTLEHIRRLWGFGVEIAYKDLDGNILD
jgi:stage V sporulation protein R